MVKIDGINGELHVIIIWQHARYMETKIINDIENEFTIHAKHYIEWDNKTAYRNFSRFYAIKSRYAKGKMKHCGAGEFLLLVVEDSQPIYEERETNDGVVRVNKNLFDKKSLYRQWTGEGHKIHATNTIAETGHNLALFFGVTYQEFITSLSSSKSLPVENNLVGHKGWRDFSQFFKILNATLDYVVLRNFEGFFDDIVCDEHLDIDLLVSNYNEVKLVSNSKEVYPHNSRVVNQVLINGEMVDFDFRSIDDNYMDKAWSKDILNCRVLDDAGFYKPADEHYFYSLLYHALIHKKEISPDYLARFKALSKNLAINELDTNRSNLLALLTRYMEKNSIGFTEPDDMSVYYNTVDFNQAMSLQRKVLTQFYHLKHRLKISLLGLIK